MSDSLGVRDGQRSDLSHATVPRAFSERVGATPDGLMPGHAPARLTLAVLLRPCDARHTRARTLQLACAGGLERRRPKRTEAAKDEKTARKRRGSPVAATTDDLKKRVSAGRLWGLFRSPRGKLPEGLKVKR